MAASVVPVFCSRCRTVADHVLSNLVITCGCGQSRTVGEDFEAAAAIAAGRLVPGAVVEVAWCHWCRTTVHLPHHCPYQGGDEAGESS